MLFRRTFLQILTKYEIVQIGGNLEEILQCADLRRVKERKSFRGESRKFRDVLLHSTFLNSEMAHPWSYVYAQMEQKPNPSSVAFAAALWTAVAKCALGTRTTQRLKKAKWLFQIILLDDFYGETRQLHITSFLYYSFQKILSFHRVTLNNLRISKLPTNF